MFSKTITPTISLDERLSNLVTEEIFEAGDSISYICDDTGERKTGRYMTLWYYITNERETSPFVGDNRIMAKVFTGTGIDYADVRTIRKALKV